MKKNNNFKYKPGDLLVMGCIGCYEENNTHLCCVEIVKIKNYIYRSYSPENYNIDLTRMWITGEGDIKSKTQKNIIHTRCNLEKSRFFQYFKKATKAQKVLFDEI